MLHKNLVVVSKRAVLNVSRDPVGGWSALSQASPDTIAIYRYYILNHSSNQITVTKQHRKKNLQS